MRHAIAALTLIALAACAGAAPDPTATETPLPSTTPSGPVPTAEESEAPWSPGAPYDAGAILDAMRESRRPGGVPDVLETEAVAARIADAIWTVDGEPWSSTTIGGSCGPVRCTVEVGGMRRGSIGEDLWVLEVIPGSGEVAVLEANLRSVTPEIGEVVDALARAAEPGIDREGLALASVRWAGPSDEEAFELSYRSGDEEGSCLVEVRVETRSGSTTVLGSTGC